LYYVESGPVSVLFCSLSFTTTQICNQKILVLINCKLSLLQVKVYRWRYPWGDLSVGFKLAPFELLQVVNELTCQIQIRSN